MNFSDSFSWRRISGGNFRTTTDNMVLMKQCWKEWGHHCSMNKEIPGILPRDPLGFEISVRYGGQQQKKECGSMTYVPTDFNVVSHSLALAA